MTRHANRQPVERYFEYALLGLLTSGFLSLASSQTVDWPITTLTLFAIVLRVAVVAGWIRIAIAPPILSAIALSYIAFYPLDYYFLSHDFLKATIHGFCFIAAIKVLTARTNRDYFYIGAIAFVQLMGSAFLSMQPLFFAWLALFILFASAAFGSADIRRGLKQATQVAYPPRARLHWRLSALALFAACSIIVIATGLFLVVPRTARAAARFFPASQRISGFSSEVDLGNFGAITQDKRAVLHVLSYKGPLPEGLKWRGTALSNFDGRRWSEPPVGGTRIPSSGGTAQVAGQLQRSRRDGTRLLYRVDAASSDSGLLFIAGTPEFINLTAPRLTRTQEGAFRIMPSPGEALTYEVSAHWGAPLPAELLMADRSRYLQLPPIDTRIWSLAHDWSSKNTNAFNRALAIQQHLRTEFTYTLDTARTRFKDPLARFLFDTKRGYCEYFASAMAVMLRTEGIPSRVVTGFQSGYYNDVSDRYVIRASDAHAWVEAFIEGRGWTTFDPTPAAPPQDAGVFSRINIYLDAMDGVWQQWILSYDLSRQAELAARMQSAIRNLRQSHSTPGNWRGLVGSGVWIVTIIVLACGMAWATPHLRRIARTKTAIRKIATGNGTPHDVTILYRRMLKSLERRGFRKPAWFTPIEFARSLPASEQQDAMRITELYNAARFGADSTAAARMAGADFGIYTGDKTVR